MASVVGAGSGGFSGRRGETAGEQDKPGITGKEAGFKIKRGDIFWADIPDMGGSVVKGRRPVLVVQNNIGNRYGKTVIVSPITSSLSRKKYPINVTLPPELLPRPSEIRLNQVLTIDKRRLGAPIARAPAEIMQLVDEALRLSLGLPGFER